MIGKRKRPADFNARAASVVADAIGQEHDESEEREKKPHAVALGRLGGLKDGKARAEKLSPERRREIAWNARAARR